MEDTIIKALLLGYAHIECNGTPIRICLKKAQGLLFYLLVHKKATRDELTGLLWGGEDNELARRHLRDNLYHLKKVVPIELVVPAGRSAIQLNPELGFYIDVDEFLKAVDVEAYQGEFLKGFSVPNCYEYEEWLERTRSQTSFLPSSAHSSWGQHQGRPSRACCRIPSPAAAPASRRGVRCCNLPIHGSARGRLCSNRWDSSRSHRA